MLEYAQYLDIYLDFEEPLAAFSKSFGGTLIFLVLASALVKSTTGKCHYATLADLLGPLTPGSDERRILTSDAVRRKITRFQKRYPELAEQLSSPRKLRQLIKEELKSWSQQEEAFNRRRRDWSKQRVVRPLALKHNCQQVT
jgi:hypothetical protein